MFGGVVEGLMALPDAALDDRLREIELEQRRLDAERAAALAVAEHRQLFADDGHRSMAGYLRAIYNWSTAEANRHRKLARLVDTHPAIGDAWLAGRLGRPQVELFARLHANQRVRDRLGDAVPMLLTHANELPYRDFVTLVERFVALVDLDGAHDDRDEAVEGRNARTVAVGSAVDVTAYGGDPLTAVELAKIHDRFTDLEYQRDVAERRAAHGDDADAFPLARTHQQRRFDAIVEIFRRADATAQEGVASEPLVNIVIDHDTWTRLLDASGLTADPDPSVLDDLLSGDVPLDQRRCETANGTQVHPHDVLRAAIRGRVRRVVIDSAGRPVDLGRTSRLFVGAAREAAKLLVTHCEHPGCELPVDWCEVDHADEWARDGGRTDQDNARIRCGPHNRAKHRHRWSSKRATDGRTYTIRHDGTIMLPVGVDPPCFDHRWWQIYEIDVADMATADFSGIWN